MTKLWLIPLGLCLNNAFAQPSIRSVSDTVAHKKTITIGGSKFGSKSPAAPLLWDDCEDQAVDDQSAIVSKGWVDPWPRVGRSKSSSEHHIMYRSVPYRAVSGPHSHSDTYLAGGHYQTANNSPPYIGKGSEDYRNVMVTADAGSGKPRWFVMFYYRNDPRWKTPCPSSNNHKVTCVQTGGAGYTGAMAYVGMRGQESSCMNADPGPRWVYHGVIRRSGCAMSSRYPEDFRAVTNPKKQWAHIEERIADDNDLGFRNIFVDNVAALVFKENCPNWFNGRGGKFASGIRSFTVGGYYRWATDIDDTTTYRGDSNNFRYFDDIYVDTTLARVVLANKSQYSKSTIVEPQIPSAWSDTSITVTTNQGALPACEMAYLFVFDADNQANEKGYPILLSSGDGTPCGAER